ncbi:unnamed protein product [Rotaria sp. Silwood2]|nr:unnamed protein product [Rotaria sp. Silwood2]
MDMNVNGVHQDEWYTAHCGYCTFILPVRYQDLIFIGQGTYGMVVRATDTTTGKYVAIKKLLHPFQTDTHAKRTYRELELLMYLNHPDAQVVQLYDVFTPEKNLNEFRTLYVFIHSAGILHRDLKPTNIGIDRNSNITILDFGLARVASTGCHTDYVATRWWRAPEIYLNETKYDEKVDIWSIGCIMAELILRRPLCPGETTTDQLNRIFDITGTPDSTTLQEICAPGASAYLTGMKSKPKKDFNELFGFKYDPLTETIISGVSPEGIDLLDRLLSFDPRKRSTAEEALGHPFLEFYHDPTDEPTIEPMIDIHQDAKYTKEQWKSDAKSVEVSDYTMGHGAPQTTQLMQERTMPTGVVDIDESVQLPEPSSKSHHRHHHSKLNTVLQPSENHYKEHVHLPPISDRSHHHHNHHHLPVYLHPSPDYHHFEHLSHSNSVDHEHKSSHHHHHQHKHHHRHHHHKHDKEVATYDSRWWYMPVNSVHAPKPWRPPEYHYAAPKWYESPSKESGISIDSQESILPSRKYIDCRCGVCKPPKDTPRGIKWVGNE